jgi:hypothetical protein
MTCVQVRRSLYATSVGKWKRYERQLEGVRERLQDLIGAYETSIERLDHSISGEL